MQAPRVIRAGLFTDGPDGPRLVTGRCGSCAQLHFPAGPTCPYCGAEGASERLVGPGARLWLYTVVNAKPPGYTGSVPYGFGVVELPEGLRVVTRLTESRLDRLRPDLPMRLVLEPVFEDESGTPVLSYAFAPEAA